MHISKSPAGNPATVPDQDQVQDREADQDPHPEKKEEKQTGEREVRKRRKKGARKRQRKRKREREREREGEGEGEGEGERERGTERERRREREGERDRESDSRYSFWMPLGCPERHFLEAPGLHFEALGVILATWAPQGRQRSPKGPQMKKQTVGIVKRMILGPPWGSLWDNVGDFFEFFV